MLGRRGRVLVATFLVAIVFVSVVVPCFRPLELLVPGPRLSKATEATLARYSESAVDARGDKRLVRTERLPPEEFCFDAAQVTQGLEPRA